MKKSYENPMIEILLIPGRDLLEGSGDVAANDLFEIDPFGDSFGQSF